ncbi:MAG: CehA/McbA family metallohydrolase [Pyrinomonadaceae bacterium MAG19_C2-C3]|nr:CehA/McbA family metallohydrolase [Pyrinomonadaceae bacterium MAG19_C2-C3]
MKSAFRIPHSAFCFALVFTLMFATRSAARMPEVTEVELQPFVAQARRIIEAMDYLGEPFSDADKRELERAFDDEDDGRAMTAINNIFDKRALVRVDISPESRVKVTRGLADATLVEKGWRSFLVKVRNEAGVTAQLKAASPNALPVYARGQSADIPGGFSLDPLPKQSIKPREVANRWLEISMFDKQPLEPNLSGLTLEYRIVQLYSRDAGRREAQISFNVGQGTQDIGFRNDVSILFTCRPSTNVLLRVLDENGSPTTASFVIRDAQERIYPAKTKRLAPDFAFQPQIYRMDGEQIRLPAGSYIVEATRGPEYISQRQSLNVTAGLKNQAWSFRLKRWVNPSSLKWYSGDHHIHAAGCSHYEAPTQGVLPKDIIRHIKGEALNVGDVLTWGPCYYFQKQFFEAKVNKLSTSENLMRYDVEISGFPSSHNGHLALLGLTNQEYPGTKKIEDYPTWNLPILKWAKSQGAVAGYAHSGWGLEVKSDKLPNYEMPPFDGIGANEYIVDVTHDAVDFISAVDTPIVWELNIWYHTLNSGFRTRIAGETDFPCIYGDRVGMGRSYVWLDGQLDYREWVDGLRDGRSYVSDGKSHLMNFQVNDLPVGTQGSELKLEQAGTVRVAASVAAMLDPKPNETLRARRYDQQPYWDIERSRIEATREVPVELIVNGQSVATKRIPADGVMRDVAFDVPVERSSWVALRILPSSHTNPVFVVVDNQPIRASRRSAEWCLNAVDQCWKQKAANIHVTERAAAQAAYEHARRTYRRILAESTVD